MKVDLGSQCLRNCESQVPGEMNPSLRITTSLSLTRARSVLFVVGVLIAALVIVVLVCQEES